MGVCRAVFSHRNNAPPPLILPTPPPHRCQPDGLVPRPPPPPLPARRACPTTAITAAGPACSSITCQSRRYRCWPRCHPAATTTTAVNRESQHNAYRFILSDVRSLIGRLFGHRPGLLTNVLDNLAPSAKCAPRAVAAAAAGAAVTAAAAEGIILYS